MRKLDSRFVRCVGGALFCGLSALCAQASFPVNQAAGPLDCWTGVSTSAVGRTGASKGWLRISTLAAYSCFAGLAAAGGHNGGLASSATPMAIVRQPMTNRSRQEASIGLAACLRRRPRAIACSGPYNQTVGALNEL
jgi:hypothetical protein